MPLDKCRLIDLSTFSDERGSLTFAQGGVDFPFEIRRIYYIYSVPSGGSRGGHGHRALQQVIIPISGDFNIVLDDGARKRNYHLSSPRIGLYVSPMIWRSLENFSQGAVCLVLASERYDEADYFHDYFHFCNMVRGTC